MSGEWPQWGLEFGYSVVTTSTESWVKTPALPGFTIPYAYYLQIRYLR